MFKLMSIENVKYLRVSSICLYYILQFRNEFLVEVILRRCSLKGLFTSEDNQNLSKKINMKNKKVLMSLLMVGKRFEPTGIF